MLSLHYACLDWNSYSRRDMQMSSDVNVFENLRFRPSTLIRWTSVFDRISVDGRRKRKKSTRYTRPFSTPIAAIYHSNFVPRLQASLLFSTLKGHVIKIAQPDRLTHLAIRRDRHRKSQERALLANAGEFNRRYLTCQIPAILYADRRDRRIKSPSVSPP